MKTETEGSPLHLTKQLMRVLVVLLLAVGLAATLIWLRDETLLTVRRSDAEPIVTTASPMPTRFATTVQFELTWSTTSQVSAPDWFGTVTKVELHPGDAFPSSVAQILVNGQARRWFVSEAPLFRTIGLGSKGEDVEALRAFLAELGYLPPTAESGSPVTRSDVESFRAYGRDHGFEQGSGSQARFEPGWVIWVPLGVEGVVGSVPIQPGQPAPPMGSPVVVLAPRLLDVQLRLDRAGAAATLVEGAVEGTLTVGDIEFPWPVALSDEDLRRLELELVSQGAAEALSSELFGRIDWHLGSDYSAVPVTAIVTDATGRCVWVERNQSFEPAPVTVAGGDLDVVFVSGINPGDSVLVNPSSTGNFGCGDN